MKGHLNGKLISRMLVDGGAIVNLMSYSLFKKLGGLDEELIKTNMTISGVGGGEPIGAKGVVSEAPVCLTPDTGLTGVTGLTDSSTGLTGSG